MAYKTQDERMDEMEATIDMLEAENARLLALVRRYRTETPLGHQPHMIADEADAALWARPHPVADWRTACETMIYVDYSCDVDSPDGEYWLDTKGYWRDWGSGKDVLNERRGQFPSLEAARAAVAACPTPPPGVSQ